MFFVHAFFNIDFEKVNVSWLPSRTYPASGRRRKVFESYAFNAIAVNPLSANPTSLPTNCLSVFDHLVGLALES